jgi:hypothetical protein
MMNTEELTREIISSINFATSNASRSLQKAIGPSEVGTPCMRKLAYRMNEVEAVNTSDKWLATIGTAVHSWLADAYEAKNVALGRRRYIIEERVAVTGELGGSVDIYDADLELVMDWKIVGETSLKKYKKSGPGEQYRSQVHLYGKGFVNAGYKVSHVAIAFLPRGGSLRGLHLWSESFDVSIADAALTRLDAVRSVVNTVGLDAMRLLPGVESFCNFCDFYLPASTEFRVGCPGADVVQPNPTQSKENK